MATSGITTFNLNVSEVIEEAFERCGLELRSGYDATTAMRSLNLLLKDLVNSDIKITQRESFSLAVQGNDASSVLTGVSWLDANTPTVIINAAPSITYTLYELSHERFRHLSNANLTGIPNYYNFDRNTNVLSVYPIPATDYTLNYSAYNAIEDITNLNETIDVRSDMLELITSGLTSMIALKKAPDRYTALSGSYQANLERVQVANYENGNLTLAPNFGPVSTDRS